MHLTFRNVNSAFSELVRMFHERTGPIEESESRNGPVLQLMEPIIITYEKPRERVLFNGARDCNPQFHLYESLWMLAGRNDVEPLSYYASNIRNYTDDGTTFNGAYGYRWRHADLDGFKHPVPETCLYRDQLKLLIEHLKAKPDSRRAVLNMWNVEDDLLKIDSSKDVCCNLNALFSLRKCDRCQGTGTVYVSERGNQIGERCGCVPFAKFKETGHPEYQYLDMTVFNRSNDLIWGMLGANVVHFSILQEYMAAKIGVEVGVYNQVSNNLHVYLENGAWKPEEYLSEADTKIVEYENPALDWKHFPLVKDPEVFDEEVAEFVEFHKNNQSRPGGVWPVYREPFLEHVVGPMCSAFHAHKDRDYEEALRWCELIKADDWRYVATKWIAKRAENYRMKSHVRND